MLLYDIKLMDVLAMLVAELTSSAVLLKIVTKE